MPLPSNLQTITLTGTYLDTTGVALSGTLTFTPPPELVDINTAIMYAAPVTATLDSSGHFSVTLICTDNPTLSPAGWNYTVQEAIKGNRSYTIYVPHTLGSTVDLSNLVPLPSLTGGTVPPTVSAVAPGYGALAYNNTWTGTNAFTGEVTVPAPVNPTDPVTLAYLDAFATSGFVTSVNGATGATTAAYPLAAVAKVTASATAAANTIVPCDTTTGALTITLPTAPADRTVVGVKHVVQGAANAVTIATGGADVFNKTGGPVSGSLSLVNQAMLLIYAATAGIWYVLSDDLPLSDLDTRYAPLSSTTGTYNARSAAYGATGNGTTDDTAAVNAALAAAGTAGGGLVLVPRGTYLISAPLVIHSNTVLWAMPGAVFNLAASSQCNMLKNAAVTAQRTITDGAITSASNVLTSATQANWTSADVGRTVQVAAALDGTRPLIANIASVTSATQVVLSVNAGATVSAATVNIYNRDTGFEVWGGTWNRGSNGWPTGASSPGLTTFQIKHADSWKIHDLAVGCTVRGYQVHMGDVTQFTVRGITVNAPNTVVNTDGINIHGPASNGLVDGVWGTCGDDFISIHSMDGDAGLQDTVGNIADLVVTNLFPTANGQAAFKVHSGSTTVCQAITCRGIHGSSLAGGVHIQDYATPTSGSILADILVEDVDCTTSSGVGLVNIYCNNSAANITLRDLVWRYNTAFPTVVYVMPGTTLNNLTVDTVTIEGGNNVKAILCGSTSGSPTAMNSITLTNLIETAGGATVVTGVQIDGTFVTCKNVKVRGVQAYKESGAQQAIVYNKGNVDTVQISDVYLNGGGIVLGTSSTASAMQAVLTGVTLESAYQLAQVASTVDMTVNGFDPVSITGGPLIWVTGASAVLSVRGRGLINNNNYAAFTRDLTQTPRFVHREMRIDVALLATNLGDEAYNTNAASAALGPVVCDGTYWYPVIPKPASGAIISGQYSLPDGGAPSSTTTFTSGQFRAYPVYLPAGAPIERLWAEVTVVGDSTSVVHLGVYADNGSWLPGALLIDAGTINGNSATVQEIVLGAPVQPTPGWYWFGGACVFSTTSPTVRTLTASAPVQFPLGATLPTAGTVVSGVYMSGVTAGALPGTFTTAGVAGSCLRIGVKGH